MAIAAVRANPKLLMPENLQPTDFNASFSAGRTCSVMLHMACGEGVLSGLSLGTD
jgi:hypothetical protein